MRVRPSRRTLRRGNGVPVTSNVQATHPESGWAARADDDGSATVLVLGCLAVLVLLTAALTIASCAVLVRHRVEGAADLAALAAAESIGMEGDPCAAARAVAAANGTTVTGCQADLDLSGRSGSVAVEVQRPVELPIAGSAMISARAKAARLPP
ncbi:MAG: hypothetical protein JWN95_3335 [Frankiales bacterium]|nr:hypothetical protein [Frankiales bacterium]